jgi:sulfatase maturation enzyme AslB (radical SAM superfamily)
MGSIHKEILAKIESEEYFMDLKKLYGEDLTNLSLWGGEPSFLLPTLGKKINKLFGYFPKLNRIFFSTNFITSVDMILDFIKIFPKKTERELGIQISIDGDESITDVNRAPGATEKIEKNIYKFIDEVNKLDLGRLNIKVNSKMTWGSGNIEYLSESIENVKNVFSFCKQLDNNIKKLKPKFSCNIDPIASLALPGKYTKNDGILWAKVCEYLDEVDKLEKRNYFNSRNSYKRKINQNLGKISNLYFQHKEFTCGAGNAMWCLGHNGDMHICHRTLFSNREDYLENLSKIDTKHEYGITNFDLESLKYINNGFVVDANNPVEVSRLCYVLSSYHNQPHFKLNSTMAMIKAAAEIGQIDRVFLNNELCSMFASFIHSALPCPTEYLMMCGSPHLAPVSLVRIFGNGAYQKLLKGMLNGK